MLPLIVCALALWRCGCGTTGLALELATALTYMVWIAGARE
jgi:hypothetical protein